MKNFVLNFFKFLRKNKDPEENRIRNKFMDPDPPVPDPQHYSKQDLCNDTILRPI